MPETVAWVLGKLPGVECTARLSLSSQSENTRDLMPLILLTETAAKRYSCKGNITTSGEPGGKTLRSAEQHGDNRTELRPNPSSQLHTATYNAQVYTAGTMCIH